MNDLTLPPQPRKLPPHSKYRASYADEAFRLTLLGATVADLAETFEVTQRTVDNWLADHPDFRDAVRRGRVIADADVAAALFTRATGYTVKAQRVVVVEGRPEVVEIDEHVPSDPRAAIFWLKNRDPRRWRDRQEVEHSGTLTLEDLVTASMPMPPADQVS